MAKQEDEGQVESRRILDRIAHEEQSSGLGVAGRTMKRARDHLSAADVDQGDWAEYWGTRIGRGLGFLILMAILVWLAVYLAGG